MTRPTKEQVDAALEAAGQYMQPPAQNFDDPVDVLAAEVRALREETQLLGEQLQASAAYVVKLCEGLEYRAEVDKLRGDEQDAWARLGAELCEAETERDRLREELAAIATNWRKLHALEDCITTRAMLSCAIELEQKFSLPK